MVGRMSEKLASEREGKYEMGKYAISTFISARRDACLDCTSAAAHNSLAFTVKFLSVWRESRVVNVNYDRGIITATDFANSVPREVEE
jgi:hypothetical protein